MTIPRPSSTAFHGLIEGRTLVVPDDVGGKPGRLHPHYIQAHRNPDRAAATENNFMKKYGSHVKQKGTKQVKDTKNALRKMLH